MGDTGPCAACGRVALHGRRVIAPCVGEVTGVVGARAAPSASSAETTDTEQRRGGSGADDGHKTLDLRQQGGRHFEAERAALERLWQSGQGGQDGGADNDKPWRD